ncbi:hypothetical protein, partial [Nereida ignava]|uniref:hypothetical protein n=1 Tax=Nereida ignava TaxID=282199 RepID=UPI00065E4FB5
QTPEQLEQHRCQRRRSWHILVHELLFKLTKVQKNTATKAQTKKIKQIEREELNTASAEQNDRRFFCGRGVGV